MYLISGLSDDIDGFGTYSIINLIGVLLAVIYSCYRIIILKQSIEVDIALHFLSLALTITNHTYKSEHEYILFLKLMWAVRNLRLLFIINYYFNFFHERSVTLAQKR